LARNETPAPGAALYLGVDGGGTQVRAVLVDGAGRERGRGQAGGANPQAAGREPAVANIRLAVARAVRQAGAELPIAAATFGIAGMDRPADHAMLLPHLRDLAGCVVLVNDAELALEALPGRCGICLIAGTGSIALGRDATGGQARAGGWGHLVGDEGSGYDIGRRALQAVLRAADGRGPQTRLQETILRAWDLENPPALMGRIYPESGVVEVAQMADVARLVFAQAAAGDAVARRIVRAAAGELAAAVLAVAARLSFAGDLPLALTGGVLRSQPGLRAAVLRRVRRRRAVGPVVVVADAALAAAQAAAAQPPDPG
jgi:N-acetylglucosamine kinase-like BadF-type ATPase